MIIGKFRFIIISVMIVCVGLNVAANNTPTAHKGLLDKSIELFNKRDYTASFSMLSDYMKWAEQQEERHRNKEQLLSAYYYFGAICTIYSDFSQAHEIFQKGYQLSVQCENNEMQFKFLNNMIGTNCSMKCIKEAEAQNERIKNIKSIDHGRLAYYYYFNKGFIAENRGDSKDMAKWMSVAIGIVDKFHLQNSLKVYPYSELYQYYESIDSLDTAINILNQYGLLLAGMNRPDLDLSYFKGLMRIYTKKHDKEHALLYQDKYFKCSDSLINVNEFSRVKREYQSFQKQLASEEIGGLKEVNLYQTMALVLSVIILIAVVAFLYANQRKKHLKEHGKPSVMENEYLSVMETENKPDGEEKKSVSVPAPEALLQRIEEVMKDETAFCDPNFNQNVMAKMIDSNTNYVSQIINVTYNKNFRTYVNEYRVKVAMERLMDNSCYGNYSIQGISESVGFKSTSNFIAAFKKYTGKTPSLYQKESK